MVNGAVTLKIVDFLTPQKIIAMQSWNGTDRPIWDSEIVMEDENSEVWGQFLAGSRGRAAVGVWGNEKSTSTINT